MVTIKIRTDNAAFYGNDGTPYAGPELARILRGIAADLEAQRDPGPIMDSNGNRVGTVTLTGNSRS